MIPLDKDFVNRCRNADKIAQKKLFAPMYRVCFRYTGMQPEAEDCVMRGFMKAFQSIEKFRYQDENSLYVWIRKIMVNESLMELRRKTNLVMVPEEEARDVGDEPGIIEKLSAEELYSAVTALPAGYRAVFNLYVIEGYEHTEIAAMLGITDSTSRTQLAKARARLRSAIEKRYSSDGTNG